MITIRLVVTIFLVLAVLVIGLIVGAPAIILMFSDVILWGTIIGLIIYKIVKHCKKKKLAKTHKGS